MASNWRLLLFPFWLVLVVMFVAAMVVVRLFVEAKYYFTRRLR